MAMYTTYDVNLYSHENGKTNIRISEDGDGISMVVVKASTDYYGKMDFCMDANEAIIFAEGIIKQAKWVLENH